MSTLPATIENICYYPRGDKILLYILARQETTFIKLFHITENKHDVYKLIRHGAGLFKFDVTINKNLTATYKTKTIPFYDVVSFTALASPGQPALDIPDFNDEM